ncbi:hypothetical protein [Emcibacter sp.]|uniref:GFA family protein n=1 Tax=Emcibacter sp. TaxID=1979954 RepID=UPI002AA7BC78|nr:hypothetical protein [Emcibacter sp.]
MTKQTHHGRCHCGNIDYDFLTSTPATELVVRQCGCSYCRKQPARHVADPAGELHITYHDDRQVTRYRFGQKTADFIFCARCGVTPFVLCETDGQLYGILNATPLTRRPGYRNHKGCMILTAKAAATGWPAARKTGSARSSSTLHNKKADPKACFSISV